MRNLAPVFWHEGLFLRPHHLQQQDRFHGDRLGLHLELLNRFHWGIEGIEIERGALKNRTVEVSRGSIVFPSGEVAVAPENAQIDPRSFGDHLPPAGQPLQVFLALPRIRPNEPNYADPDGRGADLARYRLRTREIRDEVSGENPASAQFAIANVKILFGDEDRGAFECVQIAEIIQRGPDQFELSESFIPPCVRIDASEVLLRLCNRVRDNLLASSRSLQELKRQRGEADAGLQVAMLAVNSHAAQVVHLVNTANVHPFHFYGVLVSLAGALSSFTPHVEALDFLPFAHDNAGAAYRDVVQKIEDYLAGIGPSTRFMEVRLAWSAAESCYAASLSADHFAEGCQYCLVFGGDQPPEAIRSSVQGTAKTGAPDRIETLRNFNLRGLALKPLTAQPSELPRRQAAYFQVDPVGPEWEKIQEAKKISIHLPNLSDLAVSLFVIRP
jgi:type VI secretion system protein ImpJ